MPVAMSCRRPLMPLMLVGVSACLGNTELVTPPREPVTSITLEFRADSEDAATAAALGWANGIPRAAAIVTPTDTTQTVRVVQATDSGSLLLDQLSGSYSIHAERWLTDSERALLPPGDDAVGFIAKTGFSTSTASGRTNVEMRASRRHGLVISEWKGDPVQVLSHEDYPYTGYLRLYNNADTVVYLDGLIVGAGLAAQFNDLPTYPCALYAPYALDSRGVWAHWFHQLPGRGSDYPLLPGGTAVLATDAIDHRPLYPIGLDLRRASFEFYAGAGDVDNPDVPNAPDAGVQPTPGGHGLFWTALGKVAFIARPLDPASLTKQFFGNGNWARIPAAALLDVVAMKTTYNPGEAECSSLVHPRFDHQAVQLLGAALSDDTLAYRRRLAPLNVNGRPILQYTATSAWDFTVSRRDPFASP